MRNLLPFVLSCLTIFMFGINPGWAKSKTCHEGPDNCAQVCQESLDYCLKKGGKHASKEHVNILKDCIAICKLKADFTARGSKFTEPLTKLCADICNACAASCESLDDPKLKHCVSMCQDCSESCSAEK